MLQQARRWASKWARVKHLQWVRDAVSEFRASSVVEEARTPPASWYTEDDMDELDRRAVFGPNWTAAMSAAHLASAPGSFVTGVVAREPFLVCRTDDAAGVRGFFNVCRHHATTLVQQPCGRADRFQCPYHGWTYRPDGRLIKATRLKGIRDFHAKDYGLKPLGVALWGSIIWINAQHSAAQCSADFKTLLQPLEDQLNALDVPLSSLHLVASQTFDINCNWKVFVDNYLDGGYHVEFAHKKLASRLELSGYKTTVNESGRFSVQACGGKEGDARMGSQAMYAYVYPNVMLNRYGPWLDINYVLPVSAEKCRVVFDWFLDAACTTAREEAVSANVRESNVVQQEDVDICERVQSGLRSSSFDVGRYAPNVEQADFAFHRWLHADYCKYLQ